MEGGGGQEIIAQATEHAGGSSSSSGTSPPTDDPTIKREIPPTATKDAPPSPSLRESQTLYRDLKESYGRELSKDIREIKEKVCFMLKSKKAKELLNNILLNSKDCYFREP